MRAYHHFSINRSRERILAGFSMLLLPIFMLAIFSFITKISFDSFVTALFISMVRVFAAYLAAVILAWIAVVTLVKGKTESVTLSLFDILQSLPTFTVLPIIMLYFGAGEFSIFFFLILTIIWPIIFSIVSALKQADKSWSEAITISKISGWNYLRYYLFPVTFPGVITGSIIGLGEGWEALIATELLIQTQKGLGPFFNNFSTNTPATLFGVLVFLSMIFTINKFIWLPMLDRSHKLLEV